MPVDKMNPHQKNKIDVSSLSPEEQRLFRLYGKLPSKSDHFAKHLKERKYFDSGDYAMSKAGKGDSVDTGAVGSQHPVPENIPHLSSPVGAGASGILPNGGAGTLLHPHHSGTGLQAGSPVKESSFLNRETSADEEGDEESSAALKDKNNNAKGLASVSPPVKSEGIPIRR